MDTTLPVLPALPGYLRLTWAHLRACRRIWQRAELIRPPAPLPLRVGGWHSLVACATTIAVRGGGRLRAGDSLLSQQTNPKGASYGVSLPCRLGGCLPRPAGTRPVTRISAATVNDADGHASAAECPARQFYKRFVRPRLLCPSSTHTLVHVDLCSGSSSLLLCRLDLGARVKTPYSQKGGPTHSRRGFKL